MVRLTLMLCLLGAAIGCGPGDQQSMEWTPPALADDDWQEPDGREVIRQMTEFMDAQQIVVTEARVSYEALQESGQTLHFHMLQRMAMYKPDRLFWVTLHDDGSADSAWIADGQFTLLKQPANVWGRINGPGTITAMVRRLVEEYDLDVPFRDILMHDPEAPLLGEDDTSVWWVGEAWVGGHWTNHVAAQKPGVDFELWIRKGDQPFPIQMAIRFVEEDGRPTYMAQFRKWSTTIPDAVTQFTFTPPPGAERIEVVPVIAR